MWNPQIDFWIPPDCSGTASDPGRYIDAPLIPVAHTEAEKNRGCLFRARSLRKIIEIDAPGDEHSAAPHQARRRCRRTHQAMDRRAGRNAVTTQAVAAICPPSARRRMGPSCRPHHFQSPSAGWPPLCSKRAEQIQSPSAENQDLGSAPSPWRDPDPVPGWAWKSFTNLFWQCSVMLRRCSASSR